MSITLILVILTSLISISAFSNGKIYDDLIFDPPAVTYRKQWYRFFTSGFIHADYLHLILNMFGLYQFGRFAEVEFVKVFQDQGKILYLLMYLSSLFFCLLPTYSKHKTNGAYRSLGASGAVSAVIFCFILLHPIAELRLFGALPIPGFIYGFLFLVISYYLDNRGRDNINHSAHIWGALYGIAFLVITCYTLSDYPLFENFIAYIRLYFNQF